MHKTAVVPKTRKAQATRRRLIEAAEVIFAKKGYFETSIVDITQHAKTALGTFYIYFPSKHAIFSELMSYLSHAVRQALHQATKDRITRKEKEQAGFQAGFDFLYEHRSLYSIVLQAELVDRKAFEAYYRELAGPYIRGLKSAIRRGEVKDVDPESLAYCLMGMAHFLGMRWILWEQKPLRKRQWEALWQLISSGMFAGPAHEAGTQLKGERQRRDTRQSKCCDVRSEPQVSQAAHTSDRKVPRKTRADR